MKCKSVKMKLLLLILINISINIAAISQGEYKTASSAFESMTEFAGMNEFFSNRDSAFQITQYKLAEKGDSLELTGNIVFSFMENSAIKTCVYNGKKCKTQYWIWIPGKLGDEFGNFDICNKKGEIKFDKNKYIPIKTITVNKGDSIVDIATHFTYKPGDTLLSYLERKVFRNDTLISLWFQSSPESGLWSELKHYRIEEFSYPKFNVSVKEMFTVMSGKKEANGKIQETKTYDKMGKLVSTIYEYSNTNTRTESRYFHRNKLWYKTERWEDGLLVELIIKTML